jgi:aminopeptidase N
MGAMENKGLNVFNSKYVLALPETATDDDYEGIEAVIAHEYFHNWTGNRVTCRDWFQLTLKEGLTVFRDEQFTADMTSKAVKRIDDVRILRLAQFPEDDGPMAHPIRPESYISMDNFYTATVYNKGAEVIRMYHTLLGEEGFRTGMDLYFERHDGRAVTCDDFRAAMADANQVDLDQFERWYLQAGTPVLEVETSYDASQETFELGLKQSYPANAAGTPREPLHMPVSFGLLGSNGRDLPICLEGESLDQARETHVLELRECEQRFRFTGVHMPEGMDPVPSVLRNFSAPVKLVMKRSQEELAFAMANDADAFNRWDAGQTLAQQVLLGIADDVAAGRKPSSDELFADAFGKILKNEGLDGSLKSLALTLPPERQLAQEREVIDVDELFIAREFLKKDLAERHGPRLREIYDACRRRGAYRNDVASIAARRLQNAILGYLIMPGDKAAREVAASQFRGSDNMTDSQAALACLVDLEGSECQEALAAFYQRWQEDPLVLDKWFSTQALCKGPSALDQVLKLSEHPDFSLKNPNRVRSLLGTFCAGNQVRFHDKNGGGYAFLARMVIALDAMNPQVAARMVSLFNQWRRFDQGRQELMRAQLESIASQSDLSKDVTEIVTRALKDES